MSKNTSNRGHKALTILGIVMCMILVPILLMNLTLIAKSVLHKDEVPSVGGKFPLIVLTDSMDPVIHGGDLIICDTADPRDVKTGDIIAFFDPAGNGTTVVTHRVMEVLQTETGIAFKTKGDNNNTEDRLAVPEKNLVGVYRTRIPGAGNVAMFMKSTSGLIVCVVLPILLMVCYDMIRRRAYEKSQKEDTAALMAELQALRAMKEEKEKANSK